MIFKPATNIYKVIHAKLTLSKCLRLRVVIWHFGLKVIYVFLIDWRNGLEREMFIVAHVVFEILLSRDTMHFWHSNTEKRSILKLFVLLRTRTLAVFGNMILIRHIFCGTLCWIDKVVIVFNGHIHIWMSVV